MYWKIKKIPHVILFVMLPMLLFLCSCSSATLVSPGFTFEFEGTYGTAGPEGIGNKTVISSGWNGDVFTVLVREPSPCGLNIRRPTYVLEANNLHLGYEIYSDGSIVKAVCKYRSKFIFPTIPRQDYKVFFQSKYVDLLNQPEN